MASRGSVIPLFFEQVKNGYLSITDKRMTRFNILLKDSIQMVLWSLQNSIGGEILVPKKLLQCFKYKICQLLLIFVKKRNVELK